MKQDFTFVYICSERQHFENVRRARRRRHLLALLVVALPIAAAVVVALGVL